MQSVAPSLERLTHQDSVAVVLLVLADETVRPQKALSLLLNRSDLLI
jgi:hypothetical protein